MKGLGAAWITTGVLLLSGLLGVLLAQPRPEGKKYALLVGVNEYQHEKLPRLQYAVHDVQELAALLRQSGYAVTVLSDQAGGQEELQPTKANIQRELKAVLDRTRKGDLVLLAFAGHGLQFEDNRDAFFCPCDARPFKDRTDSLLSLTKVYEQLEQSFAGMKVLLVDACRNDPNVRGVRAGIDADSSPRPPQGVAALFSCRAGEVAREHDELKHGVFFHHVLQGLKGEARDRRGQVTFAGLAAYVNQEVPLWVAKNVGEGAKQSPNLKADYSAEPILLQPEEKARRTEVRKAELPRPIENSIGMKLVLLPAGEFLMGSPEGEEGRQAPEGLQHKVKITRPFYMGVYEVTQAEYQRVIGHNPSVCYRGTDGETQTPSDLSRYPVEWVTWTEAATFCRRLSLLPREREAGRTYRLPTEAEWEYACRAGTTTRFSCGNREEDLQHFANLADLSFRASAARFYSDWPFERWDDGYQRTAPVGSFKPNPWGLYDMHGNVAEWVSDWYDESYYQTSPTDDPQGPNHGQHHVWRGSACYGIAKHCRCAIRAWETPEFPRQSGLGFRVVCVWTGTSP